MFDSCDAHDHDVGLLHDLQMLQMPAAQRRKALRWLASGVLLMGCESGGEYDAAAGTTSGSTTGGTTGTTRGDTTTTSRSCSVIPEETAGPYPADGFNSAAGGGPGGNSSTSSATVNALNLSGIVRSDIRSSIAGATAVAAGEPLTIELVNTNNDCADLSGYAIYLWHCNREGRYSLYSSGITQENHLRGVQPTGSDGLSWLLFGPQAAPAFRGLSQHKCSDIMDQQAKDFIDCTAARRLQHGLPERDRLHHERRQRSVQAVRAT